jgi:hypothetical protein
MPNYSHDEMLEDFKRDVAELKAELAEARKDTERLNWLETKGDVKHDFRGWHSAEYPQHRQLRYKSMREAIDAAMEKQP